MKIHSFNLCTAFFDLQPPPMAFIARKKPGGSADVVRHPHRIAGRSAVSGSSCG
jgi:hypothetical protein